MFENSLSTPVSLRINVCPFIDISHEVITCYPLESLSPCTSMCDQGWGLLSRFPQIRCFPCVSTLPKYMLALEHHVYIWQVLPQLSCGDTCQIWMWFKECNRYFCEIENFAYGEINERILSNPQPRLKETITSDKSGQCTSVCFHIGCHCLFNYCYLHYRRGNGHHRLISNYFLGKNCIQFQWFWGKNRYIEKDTSTFSRDLWALLLHFIAF